MTHEPTTPAVRPQQTRPRQVRLQQCALAWLLLGLLLPAGGCTFLADEFTMLDRSAPSTQKSPDAALSAEVVRP